MAISFVEAPKKKKINKATLDAAVQKLIEDTSFTIAIDGKDGKTIDITFKSQINGVLTKQYFDLVKGTALVQEDNMLLIDPAMLGVTTNMFIIEYLSNLPLPTRPNDDNPDSLDPDVERISAYGTYFCIKSEQYKALYDSLTLEAYDMLDSYLQQYQILVETVMKNTNVSQLMSAPGVLEMLKDTLTDVAGV